MLTTDIFFYLCLLKNICMSCSFPALYDTTATVEGQDLLFAHFFNLKLNFNKNVNLIRCFELCKKENGNSAFSTLPSFSYAEHKEIYRQLWFQKYTEDSLNKRSRKLTVTRCVIGASAASPSSTVGSGTLHWGEGALISCITLFFFRNSSGRRSETHTNLTQLFINLEPLQPQLFYLLHKRKQKNIADKEMFFPLTKYHCPTSHLKNWRSCRTVNTTLKVTANSRIQLSSAISGFWKKPKILLLKQNKTKQNPSLSAWW